jgi:two-component sensor histidine kinase
MALANKSDVSASPPELAAPGTVDDLMSVAGEKTGAGLSGRRPSSERLPRLSSVRTLLIAFVCMILLPAWLFSSLVAWRYAQSEQQRAIGDIRQLSRTIAGAMDFRLMALQGALRSLSLSQGLEERDFQGVYEKAQLLAQSLNTNIALVGPDLVPIFNTNAPFGAPLRPATPQTGVPQTFATGKGQVSQVFWGDTTRQWLTAVTVPVVNDGRTVFVLLVAIQSISGWSDLFADFTLPPGWVVGVLDDRSHLIYRHPAPDRFVGQPGNPVTVAAMRGSEQGWTRGQTFEGATTYIAWHELDEARWRVVVGLPTETVDAVLWRTLLPVMVSGLLMGGLTLAGAILIGRRFSNQLIEVARSAVQFSSGGRVNDTPPPTTVREIGMVQRMLTSAMAERDRNETNLRTLLEEKDLLMQEVHHRVKNSLQLVRGVLTLQMRATPSPEVKAALSEAASRIVTIADVHQNLYTGDSVTDVDLGHYLRDLGVDLQRSLLGDTTSSRTIVVDAPAIKWPADRIIPLGLVVTELLTNAIKYGAGRIDLTMRVDASGAATVVVDDEGPGFPPDQQFGVGGGLGSRLIASMIRPGEGSVVIDRSTDHGRVIVTLSTAWRNEVAGH